MDQTVEHDIWECDINCNFRREYCLGEELLNMRAENPAMPLWHCGLMEDPTAGFPKPSTEQSIHWEYVGQHGRVFDLPAFGDGSGKFAHLGNRMRRCGWSVFCATLGEDGIICKGAWAYGRLPTLLQATPAAELYAFFMYLKHCAPYQGMYVFHSDCAYVTHRAAKH